MTIEERVSDILNNGIMEDIELVGPCQIFYAVFMRKALQIMAAFLQVGRVL